MSGCNSIWLWGKELAARWKLVELERCSGSRNRKRGCPKDSEINRNSSCRFPCGFCRCRQIKWCRHRQGHGCKVRSCWLPNVWGYCCACFTPGRAEASCEVSPREVKEEKGSQQSGNRTGSPGEVKGRRTRSRFGNRTECVGAPAVMWQSSLWDAIFHPWFHVPGTAFCLHRGLFISHKND